MQVTAPSCHRVGGHRPCISAPEGRGHLGHLARRDERRKCGPRRLGASALVGTASLFRAEKKGLRHFPSDGGSLSQLGTGTAFPAHPDFLPTLPGTCSRRCREKLGAWGRGRVLSSRRSGRNSQSVAGRRRVSQRSRGVGRDALTCPSSRTSSRTCRRHCRRSTWEGRQRHAPTVRTRAGSSPLPL